MATTSATKTTTRTTKPRTATKPRATKATAKPAAKPATKPATKRVTKPVTKPVAKPVAKTAPKPVVDTAAAPVAYEAGPLLRAYRRSLNVIEDATVSVGGTSLGSLSTFGLPDSMTKGMQQSQAGVLHSVLHLSDTAATEASKVVRKGTTAAKRLFKRSK